MKRSTRSTVAADRTTDTKKKIDSNSRNGEAQKSGTAGNKRSTRLAVKSEGAVNKRDENGKDSVLVGIKKSVKANVKGKKYSTADADDSDEDDAFEQKTIGSLRSFEQVGKSVKTPAKRGTRSTVKSDGTLSRQKNSVELTKAKVIFLKGKQDSTAGDETHKQKKIDTISKSEVEKSGTTAAKYSTPSMAKAFDAVDRRKKLHAMDVMSLLAIGETIGGPDQSTFFDDADSSGADSSEEENDWEEVGEMQNENLLEPSRIPAEGVVVHLKGEGHNFNKKRGKKKFDLNDYLRKEINRRTKEKQLDLHKASLLGLLSRGMIVNRWLRDDELLGIAFSLLTTKFSKAPKFVNLEYLSKFVAWFRINFKVVTWDSAMTSQEEHVDLVENLKTEMSARNFSNYDNLVFTFVILLRSIQVDVRLLYSLQPLSLKPDTGELVQKPKELAAEGSDEEESKDEPSTSSTKGNKKKPEVEEKSKEGRKIISTDSDSDFQEEKVRKGKKGKLQKKRKSPSAEKPVATKHTQDLWAEVYLNEEERWVSVDMTTSKILCDSEIEKKATQPMLYVLAFDNGGRVKDMTRKYASNWLTYTLKQRVDGDWWNETLNPYAGKTTRRDMEEDEFLDEHLLSQPIPKTLSECKGHPMYVHNRHFLQYEALYPPDAAPVGFLKSEPIYSRDNVKTLRKRELWMREAKIVKIGEVPYKIIKRPKWDRANRQVLKDQPMELFGEWQTEDYVPPEAKDGKVPRNEYGNVELFKDKMLPKGCVHLRLPQLNRVAKKLDIDCASALTDFEYSRAGCHPVYDGFVVCEEFQDILFDAWKEDQEQQKKRAEEKRLARIRGNWRRLYKAVLIHQRMKKKYPDAFTQQPNPKRKLDEQQPSGSGTATKRRKK